MILKLEFPPEVEQRLRQLAAAAGEDVEVYIGRIIDRWAEKQRRETDLSTTPAVEENAHGNEQTPSSCEWPA